MENETSLQTSSYTIPFHSATLDYLSNLVVFLGGVFHHFTVNKSTEQSFKNV